MSERVFAVIIGSGFGGLGAAIALRKAGISSFVVLEKADAIGGTWRENTYPGCACDVPSHLYSFSFERNPRWSETYSPQAEIRAYLERCADKYDVRRHVRFGAEAARAELDEASGLWTVTTTRGEIFEARVVIGAVGPLHRFSLPKIPGLDTFRGQVIHSARWDHGFDPRGKRVAAVGAGASAIQFIPELVKDVAKLHSFQRTPAWVLPREERRYTELEKKIFTAVPAASWLLRQQIFLGNELRTLGFVSDKRILAFAERMAIRHLESAVSDPALRAILTPRYRMGCKRILMSNTYYPALARPNVEARSIASPRPPSSAPTAPRARSTPSSSAPASTCTTTSAPCASAAAAGAIWASSGRRRARTPTSASPRPASPISTRWSGPTPASDPTPSCT